MRSYSCKINRDCVCTPSPPNCYGPQCSCITRIYGSYAPVSNASFCSSSSYSHRQSVVVGCSHAAGYSNSQTLNWWRESQGGGKLDLQSIHLSIYASVPSCILQSHFRFFHLLHFQPAWCALQWCNYKQCGALLLRPLAWSH